RRTPPPALEGAPGSPLVEDRAEHQPEVAQAIVVELVRTAESDEPLARDPRLGELLVDQREDDRGRHIDHIDRRPSASRHRCTPCEALRLSPTLRAHCDSDRGAASTTLPRPPASGATRR